MIHESLLDEEAQAELRRAWSETESLRIAPFLDEELARSLLEALRAQPHELTAVPLSDLNFQYWRHAFEPEPDCDHLLCAFGRWLHGEAADWVSRLTDRRLGPPADGLVLATLYDKGCFLDAHNDYDGQRDVAFVLGLSPQPIPVELGGHLEFIDVQGEAIEVVERRAPGWNSLDLFCVRAPRRPHRIPLVREHVERRAVSGWFFPARNR